MVTGASPGDFHGSTYERLDDTEPPFLVKLNSFICVFVFWFHSDLPNGQTLSDVSSTNTDSGRVRECH